jgi:hypothetical protein
MLYVVFKDTVNNDNNETIVFHEPSDRWITFADLTYTPEGGWNEMLELTYDIVRGFENGIGYEWDEETRFAVFNIGAGLGTSSAVAIFPTKLSRIATIPAPVVTCTADVSATELDRVSTMPDPIVHISWIHVDDTDMSFSYNEYGLSVKLNTTFDIEGGSWGYLTSKPSWVSVYELTHNIEYSIGDSILDLDTVGIAPSSVNSGAERSGDVVFTDDYGNTATVVVTQTANNVGATVSVAVTLTDPVQDLTLYDASGSATNGVATIDITFTPDVSARSYNESYTLYYTITKNAVLAGNGSITGVRDERANVKTVTMTSTAEAGDIIIVYLQYSLTEV